MPRPGPKRPTMTIRISDAGLVALAKLAERWSEREGRVVKRSEVVRKMVAYGLEHHPDAK